MNIFVGNLSFEAKEADVRRVFMAFGVVTTVAIVMEKKGKKSRGFGFVEMPDEQEALAAIAQLQGKEILGRPINTMPALSKEPKSRISAEENKHGPVYKRTGKYREGRRTINYMKKRLDAGITAPVSKPRYKSNPMRWRKNSVKRGDAGETKPWQKRTGETKPWRKSSGARTQPNFKKRKSPVSHKPRGNGLPSVRQSHKK